jgi:glyoxylase-like metal-dependent hydrolase (beta-lactamase superfamily II)
MKLPNHMLAVFFAVVLACIAAPKASPAQDVAAQGASDRARTLVETALQLLGSAERLNSLTSLRLEGSGSTSSIGQGSNPETPSSNNPVEVSWVVDFENDRVWRERQSFQVDQGYFCFNSVYRQDDAFNYECVTGIHMPIEAEAADRTRPLLLARFPEPRGRLLDAIDHAESLRYEGTAGRNGRPVDVASYTDEGGTNWHLEFDQEQGFLQRALGGEVSMTLGTYRTTDEYSKYREVEGIMIPMRVRSIRPIGGTIGWAITDDIEYSQVEVDGPVDGGMFEVPADAAPRLEDNEVAVTEVADSVYFLQNVRPNYNQLLVEFDEFLLVVDAPFNAQVADATIAKIRELAPNKPIRYIVPTHFHYDHIGGLSTYVETGAQVLTTPGNRDFFEDLIARSLPDEAFEGAVQALTGRHRVHGVGPVVELIDVGPNPHADELFVVYLAESKALYVADVFSADWGKVRPAIPETVSFFDALQRLGLAVDIVLPGHGPQATWADLERLLLARRDLNLRRASP